MAASPSRTQSFCKPLAGHLTYIWDYNTNSFAWRSQATLSLTLSPDQDWNQEKCYNADNKCLQCTQRNQGDDKSRLWFLGSENVANILAMSYFSMLSVNYNDTFYFLSISFLPSVSRLNDATMPCSWEVTWQQFSLHCFSMH